MSHPLNIAPRRVAPAVAGACAAFLGLIQLPPRRGSCVGERCLRHGAGFHAGAAWLRRRRGGLDFSRLPTRTLAGRDADGCLALCCAATQHGVTFFGGGRTMLAASLPKRRRLIASDRGQPGGYAKN
jgi:hypothetical protein